MGRADRVPLPCPASSAAVPVPGMVFERRGRRPMADGLHIENSAHERAQIKETQLKQKKEQKRKSKWKTMPAKSNYISILL